jgi:hypothetical protein
VGLGRQTYVCCDKYNGRTRVLEALMLRFFAQKINHLRKNVVEGSIGPNAMKIVRKPKQEPRLIALGGNQGCEGWVVLNCVENDLRVVRVLI